MRYWILIILCLTSFCCNISNKANMKEKESSVEIIGIAQNLKFGARIFDEKNSISYYLENFKAWNSTFVNKKVIVTGQLAVLRFKSNPDSPISQEVNGDVLIIKNAKYKLWRASSKTEKEGKK